MRTIYHFPIIHTETDLGSLAESIRTIAEKKLGADTLRRSTEAIRHFWGDMRRKIKAWDLPSSTVRLYQDGLPICGKEEEIVTELADKGSQNHQVLLILMQRGAILMGTESPDLLFKEYTQILGLLEVRDPEDAARIATQQNDLSRDLLQQRDAFIARRIDETLGHGEVGVLFLGMIHNLKERLPPDISVIYPFYSQPESQISPSDS